VLWKKKGFRTKGWIIFALICQLERLKVPVISSAESRYIYEDFNLMVFKDGETDESSNNI
jgi:hypothetical protein